MSADRVLELCDVGIRFGGLQAVADLTFGVGAGELVGVIGPNGAGKTTVFNLITGVYSPTSGKIRFCGEEVGGCKAHRITRMGVARTFQNIRLFRSLSVLDNVRTAFNPHIRQGLWSAVFRRAAFAAEEREISERSRELLAIFGLEKDADRECGSLSYGDQRRLEIVRALATRPRLLLLDEPAAGMNPTEKKELMGLIEFIRERFGLAVLLVEHDMKVVMGVCSRIVVIEYGRRIAEGTPGEVRTDSRVIEAYLGKEVDHA